MIKSSKDLYFIFVILFSGLSITLYRTDVGLIVLFLIGFIIFRKSFLRTPRSLFVALAVWTGYFMINTIIIKSFHPFFFLTYIIKITIAWWLLDYYRLNLFKRYESFIYILTLISLPFWLWQWISPQSLSQLISYLDMSGSLASSKSILVYTYHYLFVPGEIPRNAGFTWEPGPFSCFISLALFFNISRNKMNFSDRKRIFIFIIGIITTQSTTGLLLLFTILLWYAWSHYKNKIFRILSIPTVIALIIYLFTTLPFLRDKIISDSEQNVEEIISHAEKSGKTYSPGRFAGLQLRWEDFKNYPIAGYGGNSSLQYGYIDKGNVVSAVNGLGTILGHYGAIGAILFLVLLFKSGKLLMAIFKYSEFIIFPLLMMIIGYSFGIIESPVLVSLWIFPIFFSKRWLIKSDINKSYENPIPYRRIKRRRQRAAFG